VIRKDTNTNQLYRTGLFPTFQLLNEAFGDQVVSAKLDGKFTAVNMQAYQNQKINYPRLIALVSSQTDGSLNVLLLNRASHMTRNVTFKSRYAYHPTQVRMLTAPNLDALNTMVFQSIQLVDGALPSDINQITVPPHCMMLLKLTRQSN
jgi:alpha-L-arabinofuranosidase